MSSQYPNGRSPQLIDMEAPKPLGVQSMPQKPTFELIDSAELARRWNIPASWVRSHSRGRTRDEIPRLKIGKYTRFDWNSAELQRWLAAHQETR